MSDAKVVALVPVSGRAGQDALVEAALQRLTPAVDQVFVLPESALVERAVSTASEPGVRVVLVHDPLRAYTPTDVVNRVVHEVLATGRPVVPVLPCSDTVKRLDDADVVIERACGSPSPRSVIRLSRSRRVPSCRVPCLPAR
jgi:hypothetical protein